MINKKGAMGTKKDFINGEILRGNILSIKLRNIKTTVNALKYVIIGYQKSK
jgi:hypothetical protein